jgi:hypothetical protein
MKYESFPHISSNLVSMRKGLIKKEIALLQDAQKKLQSGQGNEQKLKQVCDRLLTLYDDLLKKDDLLKVPREQVSFLDAPKRRLLERHEPLSKQERANLERDRQEIMSLKQRRGLS